MVRDAILGSALSRAGLVAIPDDGVQLDGFVRGPLASAIEERLGHDTADVVLAELWPLLAMMIARRPSGRPKPVGPAPRARSTARPLAPSSAARTAPPPPAHDGDDASGVMVVIPRKTFRAGDSLPVILVVMNHPSRARELSLELAGRALVRPVLDLMEMSEALEDHRGEQPILLFDCLHAPFHLESVATFASELPSGSWLALLDPSADNTHTARSFTGSTLTIAALWSRNGVAYIAESCLALLE